jgi:hypothetical protein
LNAFETRNIWKFSDKEYSERNARSDMWEEVAKYLGSGVRSAEKKKKSLRTQFIKYHKEAIKNLSGTGIDTTFK